VEVTVDRGCVVSYIRLYTTRAVRHLRFAIEDNGARRASVSVRYFFHQLEINK